MRDFSLKIPYDATILIFFNFKVEYIEYIGRSSIIAAFCWPGRRGEARDCSIFLTSIF